MINQTKNFVFAIAALAVGVIGSSPAQAQTENIVVNATVQNTLTLGSTDMNFGTFALFGGTATDIANVTVAPDGTLTATPAATGTAAAAIIDDTAAAAGQVTIADGAPGATLNITIAAPTQPTNGVDTLVLGNFTTSYNGAAATPRAVASAFTETFDGAVTPNTLDIGARLSNDPADTGALDDSAPYVGDFDVTISY